MDSVALKNWNGFFIYRTGCELPRSPRRVWVKALLVIGIVLMLADVLQAQHLRVLSARDSLGVPFAAVMVSTGRTVYNKVTDLQGEVVSMPETASVTTCTLSVEGFGFQKCVRVISGAELASLDRLFLSPVDLSLDEVVVTAQYSPLPANQAVQNMKVISSETIMQMGAVNLRDVLTNQMNVRLSQDNILGSSMSLQGIKGENIKILVDGVPVIGRLDGNIDLSQINMNNVERIELVEGPLSVQYGTNALAGTINIITKRPLARRYSGSITTYYESIGTYNLSGETGLVLKRYALHLTVGRNYFDGWNSSDPSFYWPKERVADSTRFNQWKAKESYFGTLSYRYNFKNTEIGAKLAAFTEVIRNRGYPRAPYGENAFDDYYYTKRFDNSFSLKSRLSNRWTVNLLGAFNVYQRIKTTLYRDLTTLRDTLSANSNDQDTSAVSLLMSRASFVRTQGNRFNWELGYDVSYESASGKRIEDRVKHLGDFAAFATAEYRPLSQVVVKPGIRYAYNTAYQTPLVPSLHIKWSSGDKHSVRGSYAQGFRSPTLKELYFLFVDVNHFIVGNPALRSERSNNYTLSYAYAGDVRRCRVKVAANTFYNSINNLISLAQVSNTAYSYVNIGRYSTLGVQVESSLNFSRWVLQAGFNCTGRYNVLSSAESFPRYSYSPELLSNVSYRFPRQKMSLSIFYKFTGRLPGYALNDGVVTQTTLGSYTMADLTLSRQFWRDQLDLTLGCKNLANVQNINSTLAAAGAHSGASTSLPLATGRTYFIRLQCRLSSK